MWPIPYLIRLPALMSIKDATVTIAVHPRVSPVWRWCSWRYFGPVGRQRRAVQSQLMTSQQPQSIPIQTVRRRKDKDAEGQLAQSYQILRFQKGWVNRRWFGSSLKDIRGNVSKAPDTCQGEGHQRAKCHPVAPDVWGSFSTWPSNVCV